MELKQPKMSDYFNKQPARASGKSLFELSYMMAIQAVDKMCKAVCPFYKDGKCTTHDSNNELCMDLDCGVNEAQWEALKYIRDIQEAENFYENYTPEYK